MRFDRSRATGWRYLATVLSGLLLIPALALLNAIPASAAIQTVTSGDFTFNFDDADTSAGATIVGYSGAGGALHLPTTYTDNGTSYTIVGIDDGVFENAGITSLILPSNLKRIGAHAFRGNSISSVTFPAGIEIIRSNAFADNDITSVTLPAGFDFISNSYQAFMDNDITSVSLPDSITMLPEGIFRGNQISTLVVPDGVTEIENNAFLNNQISNLTLGSAVESIGYGAFWGNSLTSITLPDSLHTIGANAFYSNDLTDVTIPASVTTIGSEAFHENPLDTVHFLGDAPTFADDGPWIPGADVTYLCAYDEAHGGGFSSPTWYDGFENHNASTNSVTGTFLNEHGSDITQTIACGDLLSEPATPVADGFDFNGWLINGDTFSFDSFRPAADVTIEASWLPTNAGGSDGGDDGAGGSDDGDQVDESGSDQDFNDDVVEDGDEAEEADEADEESDQLAATGQNLMRLFAAMAIMLLIAGATLVIAARRSLLRIE